MSQKLFSRQRVPHFFLWILVVAVFAVTLTGCPGTKKEPFKSSVESPMKDTAAMNEWVNLVITFKANTNAEMRDMAIRGIEGILMDTILVMRRTYETFSPVFTVSKNSVGDTLKYQLGVNFPSTKTPTNDSSILSVGKPPCLDPCKNSCGVCAKVMNTVARTVDPWGPYINTITDPESITK